MEDAVSVEAYETIRKSAAHHVTLCLWPEYQTVPEWGYRTLGVQTSRCSTGAALTAAIAVKSVTMVEKTFMCGEECV